jgi:Rad3-related DNA helicase
MSYSNREDYITFTTILVDILDSTLNIKYPQTPFSVMELFPFDSMRPVQKQMINDIAEAIDAKKHVIAHAPTGLGKTAAALSPALNYALEHGKTIIFLTPKHTQHQLLSRL